MTQVARGLAVHSATARDRPIFFATGDEWLRIVVAAAAVTSILWPWVAAAPVIVGLAVMLIVLVVTHGIYAMRRVVWVPLLIISMAGLQWILAAWAAYNAPDAQLLKVDLRGAVFFARMVVPPAEYFGYVVPAFAALVAGLYIPLFREGASLHRSTRTTGVPRGFLFECDILVFGGIAAFLLAPFFPPALRYAGVLATYLAFVGALGHFLCRAPGWGWRMLAPFTILFVKSAITAQFHDLFLHSLFFALLIVFTRKPRAGSVVLLSIVPIFLVLTLNGIKADYRQEVTRAQLSLADYTRVLAGTFVVQATNPSLVLGPTNVGQNIARFNQGWIIAKVMYWVPGVEPHAKGETVSRAFTGALLPRFLAPDKFVAGGSENFTRYTGHGLRGETSMNLSAAGEGFANFGKLGGWVYVFLYGLGIGIVFRIFLRLARRSVLWWAWAPYVMLWTISAEGGLGEVLNQVVKASIVMIVVIHVTPSWRQLLRGKGQPARAILGSPQSATA